jgi:carbon-monoxide dehydrogenase small subunit
VSGEAREIVEVRLKVNGRWRELRLASDRTLLSALREELGLTGTKVGCEQGECGCCTVLLDGEPVNSCLVLAAGLGGHEVLTVEGLSEGSRLNALQQAFIEADAAQCGFCTPGMLMAAKALLARSCAPGPQEIQQALAGNYCRCTGYRSILEAVGLAARRYQESCGERQHRADQESEENGAKEAQDAENHRSQPSHGERCQ